MAVDNNLKPKIELTKQMSLHKFEEWRSQAFDFFSSESMVNSTKEKCKTYLKRFIDKDLTEILTAHEIYTELDVVWFLEAELRLLKNGR